MKLKYTQKSLVNIIAVLLIIATVVVVIVWRNEKVESSKEFDYRFYEDALLKYRGKVESIRSEKDAAIVGKEYLLQEIQRYQWSLDNREITVYYNKEHRCWLIRAELPHPENEYVLDDFPYVLIMSDGTVYIGQ